MTAEPTLLETARDVPFTIHDTVSARATRDIIEALGIDPDMSVARLRADLAIAQRARETLPAYTPLTHDFVAQAWVGGFNRCRQEILGDESTPGIRQSDETAPSGTQLPQNRPRATQRPKWSLP